jgi:hypothetical protein
MCSEEFTERCEGGNVVCGGVADAVLGVGFDESYELNEFGVSDFELSIDTKMITPEGACANDGYA